MSHSVLPTHHPSAPAKTGAQVEWPTLLLMAGCVALLGIGVFWAASVSTLLAVVLCAFAIALHSSLTHEVLHGHPFRSQLVNDALVWVQPNLAVPYWRFRDTHLVHHRDAKLTDPYDDPETNYLDPAYWGKLSGMMRRIYSVNNTLAGRIVLGPLIGQFAFLKSEYALIKQGKRPVIYAWLAHIAGAFLVLWLVSQSAMPIWAYCLAAYAGLSLIRIRTFLEHQAHALVRGRTVIIEGKCPLAWLFLFNSLHAVHHTHPKVPWYDLPRVYSRNKDMYRARNGGYVFASYAQIFRQYLFKAKDPVAHPLWPYQD